MTSSAVVACVLWCSILQTNPPARVAVAGHVASKSLDEPSGLIPSGRHPGVYWTHNDGDDGILYAIQSDGATVGKVKVRERFHDFEDIAADGKGRLYLADIGNNNNSRKAVSVYRIDEPDPRAAGEVTTAQTFRLGFPAKPFNCESLFILGDHGYVISKVPPGQRASVYRFPLTPTKKKQVLQEVVTLPIEEQVTAADISADGKRLAVLSDAALYVLEIDGQIENAGEAKPKRIGIPAVQAEGCCFTGEGVLVIAESGEIFRVRLDEPATR